MLRQIEERETDQMKIVPHYHYPFKLEVVPHYPFEFKLFPITVTHSNENCSPLPLPIQIRSAI